MSDSARTRPAKKAGDSVESKSTLERFTTAFSADEPFQHRTPAGFVWEARGRPSRVFRVFSIDAQRRRPYTPFHRRGAAVHRLVAESFDGLRDCW